MNGLYGTLYSHSLIGRTTGSGPVSLGSNPSESASKGNKLAEVKLRYNPEAEEVELVVDDEVALTTGSDVFGSWVESYNEAHPVEPVVVEPSEEDKLRAQVEDLEAQLSVAQAADEKEQKEELDTSPEE